MNYSNYKPSLTNFATTGNWLNQPDITMSLNQINGLPIHDATKTIEIHITPRDILHAKRKQPASCAAAKCAVRTIDHVSDARIHLHCAYLLIGNTWRRYRTSLALRTELIAFDRGGKFMPGLYLLGAVPLSQRANRKSGSSKNKNRPGKSPRRLTVHYATDVRPHGANR